MTRHDPELEELREKVHCAVVLEQTPPCWKLDRKESTKLSLKYRRGKGEILIVSHAGRGWWDPTSDAKGEVFRLVQRLEPGLSFGHVRKRLRAFAGLSPCFPSADRAGRRKEPDRGVAARWAQRKSVSPNSAACCYLRRKRGLSKAIIETASVAGVLREGPVGSAWFAHFDGVGAVVHVDVRGPTYKGSLTGGVKTLFRLPLKGPPLPRLVLTEAAIDTLSLAAIESLRGDTLYAATGGGMGPGTIAAIEALLVNIAMLPDALICSATDANGPGDRFADRHQSLARKFSIPFERLRPPIEGGATGTKSFVPNRKKSFANNLSVANNLACSATAEQAATSLLGVLCFRLVASRLVVSNKRRRDRVNEPRHAGLRLSAEDLPVRLSATTS
jgi:Protein of unknown function (DUF3991)/Toprim-like